MPVILHADDEHQWLHDDSPESITALLAPYSDQLDVYKVNPNVNSTHSNSPQLIESI